MVEEPTPGDVLCGLRGCFEHQVARFEEQILERLRLILQIALDDMERESIAHPWIPKAFSAPIVAGSPDLCQQARSVNASCGLD
jgi:hypothetical protein